MHTGCDDVLVSKVSGKNASCMLDVLVLSIGSLLHAHCGCKDVLALKCVKCAELLLHARCLVPGNDFCSSSRVCNDNWGRRVTVECVPAQNYGERNALTAPHANCLPFLIDTRDFLFSAFIVFLLHISFPGCVDFVGNVCVKSYAASLLDLALNVVIHSWCAETKERRVAAKSWHVSSCQSLTPRSPTCKHTRGNENIL
eukprot:1159237-Pelagomonas_calceolata.AAC.6